MNMNRSDISALIRDNFIDKICYLARHTERIQVTRSADYVRVDCGLPSDTFNNVVLLKRQLQPSDTAMVEEAVHYFRKKKYPMALWLWEDEQSDTHAILRESGLQAAEMNVAMFAELETLHPDLHMPPHFQIIQVTSMADAERFGCALASLFGASEEAVHVRTYYEQISSVLLRQDVMQCYIGVVDNEVVSTGTLVRSKESMGIYDIATKQPYRGKGFGSAMFHHLIACAKQQEAKYAVLQASPDGLSIYQRAGFVEAGEVWVWE